MKRSVKRAILCLVPATLTALVLGIPTASPDLGVQNVNLSCNDATNLVLALDPPSVTALTDAVSAVNLFPAGDPALACSTQSAPLASGANGPKDFVVGGGQASGLGPFFIPCDENFSVSAHAPNDSPAVPPSPQPGAGGTFNLTATNNKCAFSGHLVSKVDCVAVGDTDPGSGNAQLTAQVTQADGAFAALLGLEIEVDLHDSGLPGGASDRLQVYQTDAPVPCFFFVFDAMQSVDRGNINVHDAP